MLVSAPAFAQAPPAGTLIGNQAIANYTVAGEIFSVTSNIVYTEVNPVYGVDIETDNTRVAFPGDTVAFTHEITNTGNVNDSYFLTTQIDSADSDLTSVTLYGDDDGDGVPNADPLTADTTPVLAPGESYRVIAIVQTADGTNAGTDTVEILASSTGAIAGALTQGGFADISNNNGFNAYQDSNLDTVTFSEDSIIDLTKSVRLADGSVRPYLPGDEVTIRLYYDNIGGAGSGAIRLTDNLDVDGDGTADLTFANGSDVFWSDGNTTIAGVASGDTGFADSNGLRLSYDMDSDLNPPAVTTAAGAIVGDQVTFVITNSADVPPGAATETIAAGVSGYIEFNAIINPSASEDILNEAVVEWDDIGDAIDDSYDYQGSSAALIPLIDSATIELTLSDVVPNGASFADAPSDDLANENLSANSGDDISWINGAASEALSVAVNGDTIDFTIQLTNHSNTDEVFELSTDPAYTGAGSGNNGMAALTSQGFPTGTAIQYFSGSSLLSGNQITVAANSTEAITVRVSLPVLTDAQLADREAGDNPTTALVTAASLTNPAQADSTVVLLDAITQRLVDLVNVAGQNGDGSATTPTVNGGVQDADPVANPDIDYAVDGAGGSTPWTTALANPGETAIFGLEVRNESSVSDSFDLNATAPSGWQVVFRTGTSSSSPIIENTGLMAANGTTTVYAHVLVPEGTDAGTQNVVFSVVSATTGEVSDSKLDAVTVNEIVDLEVLTSQDGEVAAGGVVTFTHVVENVGNVAVDSGDIAFSDAFDDLLGTIYLDTNGNGVLDVSSDLLVTAQTNDVAAVLAAVAIGNADLVLDPGETFTVFVRASAPANLAAGISDFADITLSGVTSSTANDTAETLLSNNTNTDTVTVISSDLLILKEQRLVVCADGTALSTYTTAQQAADPGQCIQYRVTVTNTGAASATALDIVDSVPAFTTLLADGTIDPVAAGGDGTATGSEICAYPAAATDFPCVASGPADGATGTLTSEHGDLAPGATATLTFTVQIDQ